MQTGVANASAKPKHTSTKREVSLLLCFVFVFTFLKYRQNGSLLVTFFTILLQQIFGTIYGHSEVYSSEM